MKKILESNRIKLLEKIYTRGITDLLYDLHYKRDFKHKQIAWLLSVPRPTITRWFKELNIPTKSCHRYTKQNLTSWLYKTGRLKVKVRDKGPDKRIQRTKNNVYVNFFKNWSPEMAYVLGFFAADGGMFINSGNSKYIQFASTDKEILEKIKKLMNSIHKIGVKKSSIDDPRCKTCYLIQIGSKEMYNDLLKLGFTPKKDLTLKFPKIPNKYLNEFIRGCFDGDGSIIFGTYKRKARNNKKQFYIMTCFVSGSDNFLIRLSNVLKAVVDTKGYFACKSDNRGYQLSYSTNASRKLFDFMYHDSFSLEYCLKRKYNKFISAFIAKGT